MDTTPFSTVIRTATHADHDVANASAFMIGLLGGKLGVEAYARYTEQLWFVYRALEAEADALRDDPVAGPFIHDELLRVPELERDLVYLRGPSWRDGLAPLPETSAYVARIEECVRDWPAGYVAHHYTRYLGDLAGGQVVRDRAEKTWGFSKKGDGVRFYVFDNIANPAAFKRGYRAKLDSLAADELEKQRVVTEAKRAFAMNTAVFQALGEEFPLSA
jgi:heme oxygenase